MSNAKVVIVGAGAAGIACATRLLAAGFSKVLVLEAEDHIGGRVHSIPFGRAMVDLGAQWCHGEDDNIVYQMVKDLNLLETSRCTYKDNTFYTSDGEVVDRELTDNLFGYAAEIMRDIQADSSSIGHYFIKNFIKKTIENFGSNDHCNEIAVMFIHWFHKLILCYDAAPSWFDISTKGLMNYKECDGDPLLNWKSEGYMRFFKVLMGEYEKKLLEHCLVLNSPVKTIVWNDGNHPLQSVLHCEDGSFYNADHIVMTTSVGVLKEKHKNMFIPELPLFKVNAIEGLGFGVVDKIMIKFNQQWWQDETCFCFLWKETDRMNVLNQFPIGPMKDGRSWLENIFGFFVIDSDPNILLGWLLGDFANDAEQLADKQIQDGCMYLLNKFLGDRYDITEPEEILITRWYSNENFRGSYSYRSVDGENSNITNKDLAEPIMNQKQKPTIQFAGEATHPYYYSTVHGAVETGYREAERLISYYQKNEDPINEISSILASKI